MLTRFKVNGFKNLVDVDIAFGPFTCVAGANGVGKSNLFDAIKFLSSLTNKTFVDAALSIRNEFARSSDIKSLFHHVENNYDGKMSFEAEMIIPKEGIDDLGQKAVATTTFIKYVLVLAYELNESAPALGSFELVEERLERIKIGQAPKKLRFPHDKQKWRSSALSGRRTTPFISTDQGLEPTIIQLHQDGNKGRSRSFLAKNLPRTVLSTVNADESPTVLLARREMESWRLLQLEPSALREPDSFTTTPGLGEDGSHLPATLYYLARKSNKKSFDTISSEKIFYEIASKLRELVDDVIEVRVDRDEKRESLTLYVRDKDGTDHPARSLSDGTLRFLALAVLEADPTAHGLICLEEPENGIHPERIPNILRLLQDIAVDVDETVGDDNPLRQVIINTHSPAVVQQVPDYSLVYADLEEKIRAGKRFKIATFKGMSETWRDSGDEPQQVLSKGKLLGYLDPVQVANDDIDLDIDSSNGKKRRVIDRKDIHQMIFDFLRDE